MDCRLNEPIVLSAPQHCVNPASWPAAVMLQPVKWFSRGMRNGDDEKVIVIDAVNQVIGESAKLVAAIEGIDRSCRAKARRHTLRSRLLTSSHE